MEPRSKGIAVTVWIVVAIGIALLALLALLNRKDQKVGLNQEIQYDDFAFSVQSVRKTTSLGSGESRSEPHGVYCVVTLKIANHAKRVDYTFKMASPTLVDVEEKEFHVSVDGQKALESTNGKRCSGPIPAGASCVTDVVFDLPVDAELKRFRISEGGMVGDILDAVFFGRKTIELSSIQ
jgi:uncharacterized protein DUF4352